MSLSAAEVVQGFRDANAAKYLTGTLSVYPSLSLEADWADFPAVGFVMLLYDHVLAISDEQHYLWKAPPSCAKYAFMVNRYLVPCVCV